MKDPKLLNRKGFLRGLAAGAGAGALLAAAGRAGAVEKPSIGAGALNLADRGVREGEDITSILQDALDNAHDGATLHLPALENRETTYLTSATLTLRDRARVRIVADHGVTIALRNRQSSFLDAENCPDLLLENLYCTGDFEPSGDRFNNKILVALHCPRVEIRNCTALGLVLCYFRNSPYCRVVGNYSDTLVDAAEYARNSAGFNYAVHLRSCQNAMVDGNVIKNCVNDGIKTAALHEREMTADDATRYASGCIITNNYIQGCVNDDGIDIFNSGERVIISNNVIIDSQKGMNLKQGRDPNAPVHEVVVSNNLIIGGRWHVELSALQAGANISVRNLVFHGNVIKDVEGYGLYFGGSSGRVIVSNCIIQNIKEIPKEFDHPNGVGIADLSSGRPAQINPRMGEGLMDLVDGQMIFQSCIIRHCKTYGIHLRSDSRAIVDACVLENPGTCGILIDPAVNNGWPVNVSNCRVVAGAEGAPLYGIYFTENSEAGGLVSGCVIDSKVPNPFNDETDGRLVANQLNTWNRTAGPRDERPGRNQARIGEIYFDTDLKRPVWWDGSTWVNANGDSV